MTRISIIMACMLLIIVSSIIFVPSGEAEVFDIGEKVSKSDREWLGMKNEWYYFDSGCMVYTQPAFVNYINDVLDGNLSTGIDHDFSSGPGNMVYTVIFPFPTYINNMSFYNFFNGSSTNYYFNFNIGQGEIFWSLSTTTKIQINGFVRDFTLMIDLVNSGNHAYFNDLIINYTKKPSDLDEILNSIDNISKRLNGLEEQIANLNNSHNQFGDNITEIWNELANLNETLIELSKNFGYLNASFYENITIINKNLSSLDNDINEIKSNLYNQSTNSSSIVQLQSLLDQTIVNMKYLSENITAIKNSMPDEYNDTLLKERISELESENKKLDNKIGNLTSEFESERDKLNKKIDEMNSTINDLKGSGKNIESKDQRFDYSVLALILIIILIIIYILTTVFFRKAELRDIESAQEPNILNEVIIDILKQDEETDNHHYNEEIRRKLDEKYQKGEISKEAYDYSLNHVESQDLSNNLPQNENNK